MERERAVRFAQEIGRRIQPACVKVALAGSARRGKAEVHDVELVLMPLCDMNLLGEPAETYSALDGVIAALVGEGRLAWDTEVKRNGPRMKRFVVPSLENMPLEFYLANGNNFGCIHAIRTGSAAFSEAIMTPRQWGGLLPNHLCQCEGHLWAFPNVKAAMEARKSKNPAGGTLIACPTETVLFHHLGLRVLEPQERDEDGVARLKREVGA